MYSSSEFIFVTKKTEGQTKKHVSQMNANEKRMVVEAVKKINPNWLIISHHLFDKMAKEGITFGMDIIRDTIRNFNIATDLIEFNYNEKDKSSRLVFKSRKTVNVNVNGRIEKCRLCFVVNLCNKEIVTVFWNTIKQSNRTPNMLRYDKTLVISEHLKKFI